MAAHENPPIQFLHECFLYDPVRGTLTWRHRPRSHFLKEKGFNIWTSRYPGLPALSCRDELGYGHGEVRLLGKVYRLKLHRVAYALMTGEFPPEVDHRDNNPSNDRFDNLRAAGRNENCCNVRAHRDRIGGLPKWVTKVGRRYRAQVTSGGAPKFSAYFDTPDEAHAAAQEAADARHGQFARHA